MSARIEKLGVDFFARDALVVARALIGVRIIRRFREGTRNREMIARVVETEAYRGPRDLASHARAGLTKRTRTLLGAPATAYVFLVYGMHECFNVVCKAAGSGHAVLLRAAEPIAGFDDGERADGPGRMARAMRLGRALDGTSIASDALYFLPRTTRPAIQVTARVGVAYAQEWADAPYRFLDAASAHVSKPPRSAIGRGQSFSASKAKPTRRSPSVPGR